MKEDIKYYTKIALIVFCVIILSVHVGNILFGKSIEEATKTPLVPEEQIFKTLRKCK